MTEDTASVENTQSTEVDFGAIQNAQKTNKVSSGKKRGRKPRAKKEPPKPESLIPQMVAEARAEEEKIRFATPEVKSEPIAWQEELVVKIRKEYPEDEISYKYSDEKLNPSESKHFYEVNGTTVKIDGVHNIHNLDKAVRRAETYYEVIFAERSDPTATKQVSLTVNGEQLLFKRGVKTLIPHRFLAANENAVRPLFFLGSEASKRKVVGKLSTYPRSIQREPYHHIKNPDGVTEAEYLKLKKIGDVLMQKEISKQEREQE
ncbi:MAG: hypothetical protein GY853_13340 [PVC group bacterium]|nr:hypothetical protein [PVC group bacterium]